MNHIHAHDPAGRLSWCGKKCRNWTRSLSNDALTCRSCLVTFQQYAKTQAKDVLCARLEGLLGMKDWAYGWKPGSAALSKDRYLRLNFIWKHRGGVELPSHREPIPTERSVTLGVQPDGVTIQYNYLCKHLTVGLAGEGWLNEFENLPVDDAYVQALDLAASRLIALWRDVGLGMPSERAQSPTGEPEEVR